MELLADMDSETVSRMLARVVHRGPDDEGCIEVAGNVLGHRRLSIVDVEGGEQPLATPDGNLYLVGTGEVYNHEEILEDGDMGTRSDNEVALRLISERGPGALSELLGMFAFLIAGEDGTLIAARDRVGIKPLYWASRDGLVRFASEMRSFDESWQPDVESFPPGHYWTPESGLVRFATPVPPREKLEHFDRPGEPGAKIPDEILEKVRNRLVKTVRRQMMGDVPVGVFLSGASTPASSPPSQPAGTRSAAKSSRPSPSASQTLPTCWPPARSLSTSTPSTTRASTLQRTRSGCCPG